MKTYVISVNNKGEGIDEVLTLAENIAHEYHLSGRKALHMRLLSEEMMGMLRSVTGEMAADFWIEENDGQFALHLATNTDMHYEKREELLSLSTSGKNAAAKGFMGKIRSLFEAATMPENEGMPNLISLGLTAMDEAGSMWMNASSMVWSMNSYKAGIEEQKDGDGEASEAWDELERSVVAKLADEVSVAIRGENVEMIIYKRF